MGSSPAERIARRKQTALLSSGRERIFVMNERPKFLTSKVSVEIESALVVPKGERIENHLAT